MKTAERQHLKTNELADTISGLRDYVQAAGPGLWRALLAVLVVVALVIAFFGWRNYTAGRAQAALAAAQAIDAAQVVPPPPPAMPGQAAPAPPPAGSFPTEQARREAALAKYSEVAASYGSTDAGRLARFRAAAIHAEAGRLADAEREFKALADQGGSSLYARMARLGLADLQVRQGQYEPAIATFRELATGAAGDLPVDAMLMQLARAQVLAGKGGEAVQALTRIVDEFPQSPYAAEAKQELERLKGVGA